MSQQRAEPSAEFRETDAMPKGTRSKEPGILQRCSSCGRSMSPEDGDILFGERWFHGVCWAFEAEAKG